MRQATPLVRPTVCVIDDDASLVRALRRLLLASGFDVVTFPSAERFLESTPRDRGPACLLVDVHLSGMTGFDLQERLVALGLSIPIVLMTALDDGPTRERLRRAGAVAYLRKPFDDETLIGALRKAIGEDAGVEMRRAREEPDGRA